MLRQDLAHSIAGCWDTSVDRGASPLPCTVSVEEIEYRPTAVGKWILYPRSTDLQKLATMSFFRPHLHLRLRAEFRAQFRVEGYQVLEAARRDAEPVIYAVGGNRTDASSVRPLHH